MAPKKKVSLLERLGLKRSAEGAAAGDRAKEHPAQAEEAQASAQPTAPATAGAQSPPRAGATTSTGAAPATPAASPWARPAAGAAAAAGGAAAATGGAAREGSIPAGPYKANVAHAGTSATSAASATEAKPLYRAESAAAGGDLAKTDAPQSRFPQPVAEPDQQSADAATELKLEETAGPSTAVLPAVPVAPAAAPRPADANKPKVGVARRTRKARLRLSRLDPWSVMKTSFLFSIAAGIMLVVAVYVVWTVLATSGLFDSINEIVASVVSTPGDTTPFRIEEYINTQKVMGVSALIACVDVVIFTALATLGSFLYNLAATMLGGLEITLAED